MDLSLFPLDLLLSQSLERLCHCQFQIFIIFILDMFGLIFIYLFLLFFRLLQILLYPLLFNYLLCLFINLFSSSLLVPPAAHNFLVIEGDKLIDLFLLGYGGLLHQKFRIDMLFLEVIDRKLIIIFLVDFLCFGCLVGLDIRSFIGH